MKKLVLIFLFFTASFINAQSNNLLFSFDDEDITASAAPSGLTAVGSVQQVALTWDANSETDLSRYTIWQATSNDTTAASKVDSSYTTSKTITSLTLETL